ncbi:hypothetical protein Q31a_00990 [Aureliella helgolandensis]|uniref:Uncharacterized protein n=1 Tax=Aureliella helgolandensis TaxID=2527968 RepID=A0A518FZU2_9BACT|nr:hypothetical protein Q31a_00990 [Aureliella helgolandensis]
MHAFDFTDANKVTSPQATILTNIFTAILFFDEPYERHI